MSDKIKKGDVVKVRPQAKCVERVGYPLIWYEVNDISDNETLKEISRISNKLCERSRKIITKALKQCYVEENDFGGNTRAVIFGSELSESEDQLYEVMRVQTKYTGDYQAGIEYINCVGVRDYDPATLINRSPVRILELIPLEDGFLSSSEAYQLLDSDCVKVLVDGKESE